MPRGSSLAKAAPEGSDVTGLNRVAEGLARVARTLALTAVRGQSQKVQIEFLAGIGFTVSEMADMAGTTPAVVSQTLYEIRKGRKTSGKNTRSSADRKD